MYEWIWLVLWLVGAGVVSGVLAGLFGIGGGAILVPVLYEFFKLTGVEEALRMHLAVGTSLAIILPTALRSFQGHYRRQAVDMPMLKIWAMPVIAGVVAGSLVAAYAPAQLLKWVFAVFASLIGLKMIWGSQALPALGQTWPRPFWLRLYGAGIGFFSSLMGIGGGSFGNMLYALYNRPIHQSVATASGLGVLIAVPGMLGYIWGGWGMAGLPAGSMGYVNLMGFALVMPMAALVAPIGVRLAHSLSKRRLEVAFGVFLWLVALRFIVSLVS